MPRTGGRATLFEWNARDAGWLPDREFAVIEIVPFANSAETFTSEAVTVENGTESIYLGLSGAFGRNRRDLETLRQFHAFLGSVISAIEATPDLPAEPTAPGMRDIVEVDNPFKG